MRIAVVAHIRHPVAEPFMGGMEAHAALLCQGLRNAGHDVTILAAKGSSDPQLIPICEEPYESVLPWEEWRGTSRLDEFQRHAFARAWEIVADQSFDVVHNNSLFPDLIDWAREDGVAMVTSQHVPPFEKMGDAVRRAAGCGIAQVTVASHSQMPLWFDEPPANVRVVHNGIDCRSWRPAEDSPCDRLVWTGRITPNKGLREAVEAVRKAGAALDIAGPIEDRPYFEECMEAGSGADIRYLGQLHGAALRLLVRQARAALVTPMWDEPFGLVAAEALASGVPVIAFDRGAMREVVGPVGLLVEGGSSDRLAQAIAKVETLDRHRCRSWAVERFSVEAMIEGYERAYHDAIAAGDRASSSSCSSTAALLA